MLVLLNESHAAALEDFLQDFQHHDEQRIPAWFLGFNRPIAEAVATLDAWSQGQQLNPGQVPGTTYFEEHNGALLGVLNLRHTLSARSRYFGGHIGYSVRPAARRQGLATRMLAEALPKARALGLDAVLLTCAPDNIGSVRAIERNGGVLEAEELFEPENRVVRRYWIALSSGWVLPDAP